MKNPNKVIIPGSLRAIWPDTRIRGINLGWVNRNSFSLPKTMAQTASIAVTGDHSILQNMKLFHCKSMETMSQGPRAVILSQRRPMSLWYWWPTMSKQIISPQRNQSQENIQLETHPQEFRELVLRPHHANLIQTQTKDLGVSPIQKWKGKPGMVACSCRPRYSGGWGRVGSKEGNFEQKHKRWAPKERTGSFLQVVLRSLMLLE
jgi:hypothetical protein